MLEDMIEVEPSVSRRQMFAQWAVTQWPKIATCSPTAFSVPAALFTDMPEHLLEGSRVDGHAYVQVTDEPEPPHAPPAMIAVGEDDSYVPQPEPAEDPFAPLPEPEPDGHEHLCPDCDVAFTTARGLRTHRGKSH